MTKNQTLNVLNTPYRQAIGSTKYAHGVVEVVEITGYYPTWQGGGVAEKYWLYFFNDELVQWGRPGDWQREADRIYEVRMR